MTEEDLRAKIGKLEVETDQKEHEIIQYLEKIEQLEDTIMRLELLIPDESNKKRKKSKDSKSAILIEEKEKEIRDLKDKMGFLRKEKVQLQQKVEQFIKENPNSTVIRIEEEEQPLEILIKELQDKINKQNFVIRDLQSQLTSNDKLENNKLDDSTMLNMDQNNGLKKCIDFKNDIINELITFVQSNETLLNDKTIQSKLKSLQDLNNKLNTQIAKF
jgi:chromosome segregation ATPase